MRPADASAADTQQRHAFALRARRLGRSAGSARQPRIRASALAAEQLAPLLEALGRAQTAPAPDGVPFRIRFAGNVQGLAVGAPVTVRGLRVGTVREVAVTFDSASAQLDVPVIVDIVPGSLVVDGQRAASPAEVVAAVATLVRRGLRAQLASTSLLSAEPGGGARPFARRTGRDARRWSGAGDPERSDTARRDVGDAGQGAGRGGQAAARSAGRRGRSDLVALRELVTAPELRQAVTDLAAAAGELRGTAGQLADRPQPLIDSLTRTADAAGPAAVATLDAARDMLAGPELREALANLTALSAELRAMPAELQARGVPLLNAATSATEQAGQTVGDARRTIAALDATFGSRSTFQSDVQALLREVTGATRSLRQVLDLLERQPDVLIRGKRGGPPP